MKESIFAHSLSIGRLGNTRQLLGQNHKGDWVILAQLPTMTDERALLIDKRALARALQFNLILDIDEGARPRPRAGAQRANVQMLKSLGALISALIIFAIEFFRRR